MEKKSKVEVTKIGVFGRNYQISNTKFGEIVKKL